MRFVDLIEKKKQKQPLTKEELHFFITGYVRGDIPDYQVSALLMAIYFNGDRKSTRLNSSHITRSRMPSSA